MEGINWTQVMQTACYLVITVVLPVIAKPVFAFFKAKALESVDKVEDNTAKRYLKMALEDVSDAVEHTFQTYVDSLKDKGEFNKEAGEEAFNRAKERALSLMSEDVKKYIETAYGDLNLWLETQIEANVRAGKMGVSVTQAVEING